MEQYEYKVVPAPTKPKKKRGFRGTEARFAHTLEGLMNEMGAAGWEYLRVDTLPAEERQGFTSKTKTFQNMLVFRRRIGPPALAAPQRPATTVILPQEPEYADANSPMMIDHAALEALDLAVDAPPRGSVYSSRINPALAERVSQVKPDTPPAE